MHALFHGPSYGAQRRCLEKAQGRGVGARPGLLVRAEPAHTARRATPLGMRGEAAPQTLIGGPPSVFE